MEADLRPYLLAFKGILSPTQSDGGELSEVLLERRNGLISRFARVLFYGDENWIDLTEDVLLPVLSQWWSEVDYEKWNEVLDGWAGWQTAGSIESAYQSLESLVGYWENEAVASIESAQENTERKPGDPPKTEFYKWDQQVGYVYSDNATGADWKTWDERLHEQLRQQRKQPILGTHRGMRGYRYEGYTLYGTRYYTMNDKGEYLYSQDEYGNKEGWRPYSYWKNRQEEDGKVGQADRSGYYKKEITAEPPMSVEIEITGPSVTLAFEQPAPMDESNYTKPTKKTRNINIVATLLQVDSRMGQVLKQDITLDQLGRLHPKVEDALNGVQADLIKADRRGKKESRYSRAVVDAFAVLTLKPLWEFAEGDTINAQLTFDVQLTPFTVANIPSRQPKEILACEGFWIPKEAISSALCSILEKSPGWTTGSIAKKQNALQKPSYIVRLKNPGCYDSLIASFAQRLNTTPGRMRLQ